MSDQHKHYDFLIAGSGFAGSITALCLKSAGFSVCLVEKESHPRFTIGESSTPIADMILRDLADTYNLPELKKLSRYGAWQTHYPEIKCGIKRGFSYYKHSEDSSFSTDTTHSHELLVAASINDENSDTQWYRPDTDYLFVRMVKDAGIDYMDRTEIKSVERSSAGSWSIQAEHNGSFRHLTTGFIIDATGSPGFSERFFGTKSSNQDFRTNTLAIYSHFENVPEWHSYLIKKDFKTSDYPYHPDHSALHHLLDEGWLWMLRFNDGLLSAGLVLDGNHRKEMSASDEWRQTLKQYPSLQALFSKSKLAGMPGKLIKTGRLQRKLNNIFGDGWAALHHTAGFVDPLHSTGIAHSLAGVEKLLSILINTHENGNERQNHLQAYQKACFNELSLIDLLVDGCFKSRQHFDLFTAYSMLYFTCTIQYEQRRLAGKIPDHFLSADHSELTSIVESCYNRLSDLLRHNLPPSRDEIRTFENHISERIQPFNTAGLMDPSKNNMYSHTAVTI